MSGASRTAYDVTIGGHRASSDGRSGDRQLVSLVVELSMDGTGGRCVLELGGAAQAPAEAGDAVVVKLDIGDGAVTVFTGEAYASAASAVSQSVRAADDVAKLASMEVQQAYQEVSSDFIVNDLISKAGATAGRITPGPYLSFYAVHAGMPALAHVRALAALTGADIYTDGRGHVQVAAPRSGGADHTLSFGATILAMDFRKAPPAFDGVQIWGEGAASSQGKAKAHWLCTDLSGVKGQASVADGSQVRGGSAGNAPRQVRIGAVREGAVASDVAKALATNLASCSVRGSIDVYGAPAVMPGDLLAINKLPLVHSAARLLPNAPLRVRSVRHTLSRERGLRTRIEV